MQTWIALFRGINVGGNHMLPMKALVRCMEKNGCTDVKTYIQSGNAVFRSKQTDASKLEAQLRKAVARDFGFDPRIVLLTQTELAKAARDNPFPAADAEPKSVHLFFLVEKPVKPDLAGLEEFRAADEAYLLKGKVFYLHTPSGFGISKLAEKGIKSLGVDATAPNWRTVTTVLEMARALA